MTTWFLFISMVWDVKMNGDVVSDLVMLLALLYEYYSYCYLFLSSEICFNYNTAGIGQLWIVIFSTENSCCSLLFFQYLYILGIQHLKCLESWNEHLRYIFAAGSTQKPEDMYRIIEHFALGRRRLELFGEDHNIRSGWLTVGKGLSSSNFNLEVQTFACMVYENTRLPLLFYFPYIIASHAPHHKD